MCWMRKNPFWLRIVSDTLLHTVVWHRRRTKQKKNIQRQRFVRLLFVFLYFLSNIFCVLRSPSSQWIRHSFYTFMCMYAISKPTMWNENQPVGLTCNGTCSLDETMKKKRKGNEWSTQAMAIRSEWSKHIFEAEAHLQMIKSTKELKEQQYHQHAAECWMSLRTTKMFTEWELRVYVMEIRKINSILFLVTKLRLLFAYNFRIGDACENDDSKYFVHICIYVRIFMYWILYERILRAQAQRAMFVFPHRVGFFFLSHPIIRLSPNACTLEEMFTENVRFHIVFFFFRFHSFSSFGMVFVSLSESQNFIFRSTMSSAMCFLANTRKTT